MVDLRLKGAQLSLARRLAESPRTRALAWALAKRDFHTDELARLGADARAPLDDIPCPVAGAPPRAWTDAGLAPPATPWCSGRMLREAYARGETTPSEVLARIEARLDARAFGASTYSPFIELDLEVARREAEASTERHRRGAAHGPLDGVPVPVKDELHVRGLPTRGGTRFLTSPAPEDAWLVARLRAAGALVYGKTHATEWGMNPLGMSDHFDMPRSPYRSDRGAGGSSTGSGVAVGLGLATVAVGSDGGCSIRVPATHSGVLGLKPSFHRLGRTGDIWAASTMGHLGPIGQSTEDLVDLLEATAGVDPDDPGTRFATDWSDVVPTWRRALGRGVRGARIGVLTSELADADAPIARACEAALAALEREGAVLIDVEVPLARHAPAVGALTIASESVANTHDHMRTHGALHTEEYRLISAVLHELDAQSFLGAARVRAALRRELARVMAGVDLLALPGSARVAPPYALDEGKRPLMDATSTAAMTRFAFLGNLTGVPAITFPVGMHDGLPVSLQLMGDAWDEASVLAGAAHAERIGLTHIERPTAYRSLLAR